MRYAIIIPICDFHSLSLTENISHVDILCILICWNMIRFVDDDDEKNRRKLRVEEDFQSLPCKRYRVSLKRMAQRDILTFYSQDYFESEFLAWRAWRDFIRTLWNSTVKKIQKRKYFSDLCQYTSSMGQENPESHNPRPPYPFLIHLLICHPHNVHQQCVAQHCRLVL